MTIALEFIDFIVRDRGNQEKVSWGMGSVFEGSRKFDWRSRLVR